MGNDLLLSCKILRKQCWFDIEFTIRINGDWTLFVRYTGALHGLKEADCLIQDRSRQFDVDRR